MNRILFVALLAILFVFADFSRAQEETEIVPAVAAGIGLAAAALGYQFGSDRAKNRRDDDVAEIELFSPVYMTNFAQRWNRLTPEEQEQTAAECIGVYKVLPRRDRAAIQQITARIQQASTSVDSDMAEDAECLGICTGVAVVGGLAIGGAVGYWNNRK
eukprot:CAMPEP_0117440362 /NCGR_PEP_ID=MMETSP0759-20121206/3052_1 /TAXON_ID=63605 /ORGANISM="Percolomonas cosmopolitus, Strain WS" /LENGTH=158 /DNA_ID=CAMNT_0005232127 /DNA_START=58 /DNA_END=534 /DNA_ORIENTATION=-